MPSGRTVPGMRGRCGRVTRRSGRRSPSAPPHQGWGTTGSATHTHRRGSGSGLRFSFAWVGWYESIIRGGEGHLVPRCAGFSSVLMISVTHTPEGTDTVSNHFRSFNYGSNSTIFTPRSFARALCATPVVHRSKQIGKSFVSKM